MRTLYQTLNCLPGPHGRQRHLKVGRGRQKYDFLYDRDIHSRNRTRNKIIGTMYMFIYQFFKGNSNFDILEVVKPISGTQLDLENGILMDDPSLL